MEFEQGLNVASPPPPKLRERLIQRLKGRCPGVCVRHGRKSLCSRLPSIQELGSLLSTHSYDLSLLRSWSEAKLTEPAANWSLKPMITQVHILIFPIMKLAKQAAQENPSPGPPLPPVSCCQLSWESLFLWVKEAVSHKDKNFDFVAAECTVLSVRWWGSSHPPPGRVRQLCCPLQLSLATCWAFEMWLLWLRNWTFNSI